MIENIVQAKKHLKEIIDFYKLNDENNYDYTDKDLISIRIVLEEIERLKNLLQKKWEETSKYVEIADDYEKRLNKAIEYIEKATKETNFENDKLIDVLDILKDEKKTI